MGLELGDFVRLLLADETTRVVLIYAEHIRQPAVFLEAAAQARAVGKAIIMLHPGRSARAKEAAKSHTGALVGDYAVMRAQVERAGVLMVDTLDEMMDATEILSRYPKPSPGGLGILTFSGAFCGIAHDFCEDVGIKVPPLSAATETQLKPQMPSFISPRNPLDLGTQPLWQPELVQIGLKALLREPAIGGVAMSIPAGAPKYANAYLDNIIAALEGNEKPVALAMLGDGSPLPPEFIQTARENKIVLSRSSDRTLRAMSAVLKWGSRATAAPPHAMVAFDGVPDLPRGMVSEWLGKKVLAAAGIRTPKGELAKSAAEAVAIATKTGFPVVLKAQASALAHKTEAGGVILNLADADEVRRAWSTLVANVERARPGLALDGMLVEAMAPRGLELVIGGRRDPHWGPVVLVGLGGILVEALQDVRTVAANATKEEFIAEFEQLKTAKLLHGFRNLPAFDVEAAASAAQAIGRLLLTRSDISEIEINPLMIHARGHGATALDALIVVD
jgi:acyl-CoA synthetase (NDP forming)